MTGRTFALRWLVYEHFLPGCLPLCVVAKTAGDELMRPEKRVGGSCFVIECRGLPFQYLVALGAVDGAGLLRELPAVYVFVA